MEFQMKSKTVIAAAMLLASILSTSAASIPANADTVSAGKTIAAENGIILDSDTNAAELAVLNDLNGGILPAIEFADACTVSHINGLISGRTVRNARGAKAAIASVSGLLGIQDADSELMFMGSDSDEYDTDYTFRQLYQGVPVEDAFVTVFADAETLKADYLNSSFVTGLSLDTTPAISADRVRDIVREIYQSGLMKEPELMIIRGEDGVRRLAYEATAYDLNVGAVYISAEDGSVLRGPSVPQHSNYDNPQAGGEVVDTTWDKGYVNPITGLRQFTIKEARYKKQNSYGLSYSLHDGKRDIWLYKQDHALKTYITDEVTQYPELSWSANHTSTQLQQFLNKLDPKKIMRYDYRRDPNALYTYNENMDSTKIDDTVRGVMYQVECVYDYFSGTFDWYGTTNLRNPKGKTVTYDPTYKPDRLLINPYCPLVTYKQGVEDGVRPGDADANNSFNIIRFGRDNEYYNHPANEIAIVAHEYTHRILNNKLLWSEASRGLNDSRFYGEVAALDEAYADIMGQYAELAVKGSMNWKTGDLTDKNGEAYRDLTRGEYYERYVRSENTISKHYFKTSECASTSALESHEGATIIGHAAYRMSRAGIAPSDAQKIWFKSIDYLKGTGCKFRDCRTAVVKAAKEIIEKMNCSDLTKKELMIKVYSAFNYAEVFPGNSKPMGDINKDGIINADDVALTKRYANNANLLTDPEQIALGDVNYDGRITKQDAQIIQNHINQYGNRRTWEYHFHYDI